MPRQSFVAEQPIHSSDNVQYLNNDEIDKFLGDVDPCNSDGYINYSDVEQKLDEANDELVRQPRVHHVIKRDCDTYNRHNFLRSMMGPDQQRITRDEFARIIREWKIPSYQQVKGQPAGLLIV